jgi:predicted N-formylglutamate amidohydrolase
MTPDSETQPAAALAADDPPPFELVNGASQSRAVLLCDHAGRAIPRAYGALGLDETVLRRHIAWDIGAGDVTRRLAQILGAPAVLANYSRLFIDTNRHPGAAASIVEASDGVAIPGNADVDEAEKARRASASFWPYQNRVIRMIGEAEARAGVVALICIHSFTPVMDGFERPWHIGVLWNQDGRIARPLIKALGQHPGVVVGDNKPYSGSEPPGYGLNVYGSEAGRPHVTIEVRQDLIDTHHGADEWAHIVAAALGVVLADDGLYRVERFDP